MTPPSGTLRIAGLDDRRLLEDLRSQIGALPTGAFFSAYIDTGDLVIEVRVDDKDPIAIAGKTARAIGLIAKTIKRLTKKGTKGS